ncbi:MAG: DMT family transporter [Spirochaetales bacterium]|nr:DMT family transporter [Spirochaetales bacterium]
MILFIMMLGMAASGASVVFAKMGVLHPVALAAWRLLLSGAILFPWFLKDMKSMDGPFRLKQILPSLLPGVFLAAHFVFFIFGARLIPGAHASLITTLSPIFMPFLMFFLIREKITPWEILGSILALSGALFLGLKDSRYAAEYIKGDVLCFIGMLFVTLYLALARRNRKNSPLWFYMIPLYMTGGIICLVIAAAAGADLLPRSSDDWISILGLSVISTVAGHSINNFGMRKLRGQLVSLLNLTQILFASFFAFLVFAETPPVYFYPAAVLILSGPLLVILVNGRDKGSEKKT